MERHPCWMPFHWNQWTTFPLLLRCSFNKGQLNFIPFLRFVLLLLYFIFRLWVFFHIISFDGNTENKIKCRTFFIVLIYKILKNDSSNERIWKFSLLLFCIKMPFIIQNSFNTVCVHLTLVYGCVFFSHFASFPIRIETEHTERMMKMW